MSGALRRRLNHSNENRNNTLNRRCNAYSGNTNWKQFLFVTFSITVVAMVNYYYRVE
jgi:hypothetical protein